MIISRTKVPNSLLVKLSRHHVENNTKLLVNEVGGEALRKVKAYGIGTAGGNDNPTGGAPVWQGEIEKEGHYRGYLSDSHHLNRVDDFHVQIVTSADFADGVIEGYSTNGQGRFLPNRYHKRAVDEIYSENHVSQYWDRIVNGIGK